MLAFVLAPAHISNNCSLASAPPDALCSKAWVSAVALGLQAAYLVPLLAAPVVPPADAPKLPFAAARLVAALGLYGSPFVACLVGASLAALVLRADPLHAAAARLLSWPGWRLPADLSYSLYLLHELVKVEAVALLPAGLLPALVAAAPLAALGGIAVATLALGYAAAWLCWRLVERSF